MFDGAIPICFLISAIFDQTSRVYWSEGGTIRQSPLDNPATTTLISGLDAVECVSVDTVCENKVFWTTGDFGELGRANLDGSDPQQVSCGTGQIAETRKTIDASRHGWFSLEFQESPWQNNVSEQS